MGTASTGNMTKIRKNKKSMTYLVNLLSKTGATMYSGVKDVKTNLPTANTVSATEDPSLLCLWSYRSGSNMPSQMMGAFQEVHVCTSGLDLK